MPEMSGFDVAREVRKTHDATSLPIIMLTARTQVKDLKEGFECGVNDYLTKPFNRQELFSRIKSHIFLSRTSTSYQRFVPKDLVEYLGKESILEVNLGDQMKADMSVMFTDVPVFAGLSNQMNPQENFDFLNSYLQRMEPVILRNKGHIDKYIGDAIMAVFKYKPDDAVNAGIQMLLTLAEFNKKRLENDYKPVNLGIGINSGQVMLGTIGGHNRIEETVISDAVNLAARIVGLTKFYGTPLLITANTLEKIEDPSQFLVREIDLVRVKGKADPVEIFEVFNSDDRVNVDLKIMSKTLITSGMYYRFEKKWDEAIDQFTKALGHYPNDSVALKHLEVCKQMRGVVLPDNWDGSIDFP